MMLQILDIFLAGVPISLIIVLMLGFRWKGARAGAIGWLAAIIIAAWRFGAGLEFLFWSQIRGVFQALYVLYIIWGALFFFRVTEADGTLKAISDILKGLSPNRALQVLILAWAFASFLQGVGGFGVPVAVVAPILVGLGYAPIEAVLMPSIGHAWAISFGSLGSSFQALTASTGLAGTEIALWMAIALSVLCFEGGVIVLWIANERKTLRPGLVPMLLMAMAMIAGQLMAVRAEIWTIAAMLGALAGLIVGTGWALWQRRKSAKTQPKLHVSGLDMLPYGVLLVIIFAEKFIVSIHNFLGRVNFVMQVPTVSTTPGAIIPGGPTRAISLFGHPGALLLYTGLITLGIALIRKTLPKGAGKRILNGVARSGMKSTLGILTLVCMSMTMRNAGMIPVLSQAMADIAGALFPLVSPFIGALGAFITGSNTNSNIIFGAFQRDVAETLHYVVPVILAAHNAGAAAGSVFAPAKVIVGCSTVGLSGGKGESEALRHIVRYGLIMVTSVAILAWVVVSFS